MFIVPDLGREERTLAIICHLSAFATFVIPIANILGPLIIYFMKKDESEFVKHHALEAMNFQISLLIALIGCALLMITIVGIIPALIMIIFLGVLGLIAPVIAALKANDGEYYYYPFSFRLISLP